jgi:hypothetical protein
MLKESTSRLREMEVVLSDEDLEALGVEDFEAADIEAVSAEVVPADAEEEAPEEDAEEEAPEEDGEDDFALEGDVVDDNNPKFEEADTVEEAKLRRIIRREVESIVSEVLAAKDEKGLRVAQNSKKLSSAMKFTNPGFGGNQRPQRRAARGPGGRKGFGGPGF